MDLKQVLDLARKQGAVELVGKVIDLVAEVQDNAARGVIVLAAGQQADFDQIHHEALAANAELDAKLAAAERR